MEIGPASYGLALVAGVLSILSPCVLPVAPIVIGGAAAAHRRGPLLLIAGLVLSFTTVGTLLATIGPPFGIDEQTVRRVGAVLMIASGLVLLGGAPAAAFEKATAGIASRTAAWLAARQPQGWRGQFVVGALLGLVWMPCVGPTLGAAMAMAAQGSQLVAAAGVMAAFALGAATPLATIGWWGRSIGLRLRGRLASGGAAGRRALGVLL
jgi:cytochrome c biogenesis protein CcdA